MVTPEVREIVADVELDVLLASPSLTATEIDKLRERQKARDYLTIDKLKFSQLDTSLTDDRMLKDIPLSELEKYISAIGNLIVIPIASGKGGAGKTTIAAAIIYALGKRGYKVTAADFDRLPKLHGKFATRMIGYDSDDDHALPPREVRPENLRGIDEFFDDPDQKKTLDKFLFDIRGHPNVGLLVGAMTGSELITYTHAQRNSLMGKLSITDTDIIVVDMGAGLTKPDLEAFYFWHGVETKCHPILVIEEKNNEKSHDDAYKFVASAIDFAIRDMLKTDDVKKQLYEEAYDKVMKETSGKKLSFEQRTEKNPETMRKICQYIISKGNQNLALEILAFLHYTFTPHVVVTKGTPTGSRLAADTFIRVLGDDYLLKEAKRDDSGSVVKEQGRTVFTYTPTYLGCLSENTAVKGLPEGQFFYNDVMPGQERNTMIARKEAESIVDKVLEQVGQADRKSTRLN